MKVVNLFTFYIFLFFLSSINAQIKVFNSTRPQFESPIAINPTDPNNLIGTSINDASTNNFRIAYFYTTNGGTAWNFNENFSYNSYGVDPMVSFDPDGNAYLIYQNTNERALYMRKSTDGGINWVPSLSSAASNIIQAAGTDIIDRPCLAISPIRNTNGNSNIYISYNVVDGTSGIGFVELARSTDGGASFSSIYSVEPPTNYHYLGSFIDVGADGEIILS